ncbi:membrane protein [Sphingobacterium kyonggiense]|uniref:Membrane protein n=1 Tax=Sphingobacterium kyonggiense TaxID=714075 RepID=A0ABP7YE32_9SPHI
MSNLVRIIICSLLIVGTIALFWFGHWGWGILAILITILAWVTVFFNEKMLLAQWFLRKERMDKAEVWLKKINNYESELIPAQHGYYHMLLGLIESQRAPLQSEKFFKKALTLGLHMDHSVALAKLSLAGIAMAKRNKREAEKLLAEAKKADKNKLLEEQIKLMKSQMGMMDKQQFRYSR